MRQWLLVSVICLLGGCLNTGIKLPKIELPIIGDTSRMTPEHAANIETAGVVSLLESTPRIQFIGSSLKDSNLARLALDDWDVNAFVSEKLGARLKQRGFAVKRIDTTIPLKEAYSSSASYAEPDRNHDRLIAIGKKHNVDMIVVVYRQVVKDYITKSSQKINGYGLYKRRADGEPHAFAVVRIEAINVKRGYTLGKGNASVKVAIDETGWQQSFESEKGLNRVAPARADYLRNQLRKAVGDVVVIGAQEIGVSN